MSVLEYRAAHKSLDDAWIAYAGDHPLEGMTRKKFRQLAGAGPTKYPQQLNEHPEIHDTPILSKVMCIPDIHRPYHDQKAWDLIIRCGRFFNPDILVQSGDAADFYAVSAHNRSPARKKGLGEEIKDVNKAFDDMDSLGAKRKEFTSGNHEDRLARYFSTCAPALYDLPGTSIPELFNLQERGWNYTPYRHHTKLGHLYLTHDAGGAGGQAHAQAGHKFAGNVVIGHVHRINLHVFGSATGETHVAASFGWVGSQEASEEYQHDVNKNVDWALGFGTGWMDQFGNITLSPVPIINYTAVVNGTLIT